MWLKYVLLVGGIGMFGIAMALVMYDLCVAYRCRKAARAFRRIQESEPAAWRVSAALIAMSWAPLLIALSLLRQGH